MRSVFRQEQEKLYVTYSACPHVRMSACPRAPSVLLCLLAIEPEEGLLPPHATRVLSDSFPIASFCFFLLLSEPVSGQSGNPRPRCLCFAERFRGNALYFTRLAVQQRWHPRNRAVQHVRTHCRVVCGLANPASSGRRHTPRPQSKACAMPCELRA